MSDIPYGYCQCGCGQKTLIATRSRKSKQQVKGQPFRFIFGHAVNPLNARPHPTTPIEQRFWKFVDKRGADDCWEWQGSRTNQGYGRVSYNQRSRLATHVVWLLTHGHLPSPLLVCHTCDNPPCCNPKHLFLGTKLDNAQDASRKNRFPDRRGEKGTRAILTEKKVREAKALHETGWTYLEISKRLGVSKATISHALTGRNWSHLK